MIVTVSLGYPAVSPEVDRTTTYKQPCELESLKRKGCKPEVNTMIQLQCDSNGENNICNATCDGDGVNGKDTTVTSKKPDSWSFVYCVVNVVSFQSKVIG